MNFTVDARRKQTQWSSVKRDDTALSTSSKDVQAMRVDAHRHTQERDAQINDPFPAALPCIVSGTLVLRFYI